MDRLVGLALVLTAICARYEACFIQQCPFTFGKLAYMDDDTEKIKKDSNVDKRSPSLLRIRQCAMCGDSERIGQCFGPATCCFDDGCMIGKSPMTINCLMESLSERPCVPRGTVSCSVGAGDNVRQGFCSPTGVCCTDDICVVSRKCESPQAESADEGVAP